VLDRSPRELGSARPSRRRSVAMRAGVRTRSPGVLQLRDHVVTTTVITDVTFEDGSGYENTQELVLKRPHHTAVVAENKGAFGLVIFEQNVDPGGKKVQRNALPLAALPPAVITRDGQPRERQALQHSRGVFMPPTRPLPPPTCDPRAPANRWRPGT
jgi:hypothetical protein